MRGSSYLRKNTTNNAQWRWVTAFVLPEHVLKPAPTALPGGPAHESTPSQPRGSITSELEISDCEFRFRGDIDNNALGSMLGLIA